MYNRAAHHLELAAWLVARSDCMPFPQPAPPLYTACDVSMVLNIQSTGSIRLSWLWLLPASCGN